MRHRLTIIVLVCVALCAGIGSASAQTAVANPTTIEWIPSSDHAILGLDGQPLVSRYDVALYLESSQTTPVIVFDAGKPAPVASKITIINPAWFVMPLLNVRYVAKVSAVGPTGVGQSTASNPFGTTGPPAPPGSPTVTRPPSGPDTLSGLSATAWFGSVLLGSL